MEDTIEQQIAELGRMTVGQLKQKYIEVFGEENQATGGRWNGFAFFGLPAPGEVNHAQE